MRGEWLALCADEEGVSRFLNGDGPPKFDCLIADLEASPYFEEKVLSQIKGKYSEAMCDDTLTR